MWPYQGNIRVAGKAHRADSQAAVARHGGSEQPDVTALFDDFRDLLVELHHAGADFVVLGGYAVSFYGHPRATKDLDVFVRPDPVNASRVIAALRQFGAPLSQLGISESDFATAGTVVQLGVPPVRIDLITEASGITFAEAMQDHGVLEIDGTRIPVIGREALLRNKRAAARPQDIADVDALSRSAG